LLMQIQDLEKDKMYAKQFMNIIEQVLVDYIWKIKFSQKDVATSMEKN